MSLPSFDGVTRTEDGGILAPVRAVSEDGGAVGDAMIVLYAGDEMFAAWDKWLTDQEEAQ